MLSCFDVIPIKQRNYWITLGTNLPNPRSMDEQLFSRFNRLLGKLETDHPMIGVAKTCTCDMDGLIVVGIDTLSVFRRFETKMKGENWALSLYTMASLTFLDKRTVKLNV